MNAYRVPRKILSIVLSMLMAISCLTVGFYAVAEDVNADAPIKAFQRAVNAWISSDEGSVLTAYSEYDVASDENDRASFIQDNTSEGYIYDIAVALVPVVNTLVSTDANEGANSMVRMREAVKEATGFTSGRGASVINALLPDVLEYDADYPQTKYIVADGDFEEIDTCYVEVGLTAEAAFAKAGDKLEDITSLPATFCYSFEVNENVASNTTLSRHCWYSFAGEFSTEIEYANDMLSTVKSAYNYFKNNAGDIATLVAKGDKTVLNDEKWAALEEYGLSAEFYEKYFTDPTLDQIADYMTESLAASEVIAKTSACESFVAAQAVDFSAYTLDELNEFYADVKADYDLIVNWGYLDARDYIIEKYNYDKDAWKAFLASIQDAIEVVEASEYLPEAEALIAELTPYYVEDIGEFNATNSLFKSSLTDEVLTDLYVRFAQLDAKLDAFDSDNLGAFAEITGGVIVLETEIENRGIVLATETQVDETEGTADQRTWPGYSSNSLINQSTYCTRTAQKAQSGKVYQDVARHYNETDGANSNKDNYVVTKTAVQQVLYNIDNWLSGDAFAQVLTTMLDDSEKDYSGVSNLSDFIVELFNQKLFNDDMLNSIMDMLFTDLVSGLPDLVCNALADMNDDARVVSSQQVYFKYGGSSDYIAGNKLAGIQSVDGQIYLNGGNGTWTFPELFHQLGIELYPGYMASAGYFDNYPTIKTALQNAGNGVNAWSSSAIPRDDDGKIAFNWGCTNFAQFKAALVAMLSGINPLLQCLFCGNTFTKSGLNKVLVLADGEVKYAFLTATSTIGLDVDSVTATVTIGGLTGMKDVIYPIYEALGVNTSTLQTYINKISTSSNCSTIVDVLVNPIWDFVTDTLCAKPLETVVDLLPTLAYAIQNGLLESLLAFLGLNINLKVTEVDLGGGIIAGIVNLLQDIFIDKLDFDIPLQLFEYPDADDGLVKLYDILELENSADMRDMNKILNGVLAMLKDDDEEGTAITIKNIDQAKLAGLGTAAQTSWTARTSACINNFHYKITADEPSVLYDVLTWVFKNYGNSTDLINLLQVFDEDFHLNGVFTNMIDNIGANYNDVFAALIELFYPQQYGYAHTSEKYEALNSTAEYTAFNGTNNTIASQCYLKYGNTWTESKAKTFYEDAEELIDGILDLIAGEDEEALTLGGIINDLLNTNLFTVELVAKIASLLGGLAYSLENPQPKEDDEGNLVYEGGKLQYDDPKLGDNITQLIKKELGGTLTDLFGEYSCELHDTKYNPADEDYDGSEWLINYLISKFNVKATKIVTGIDEETEEETVVHSVESGDFFDMVTALIMPIAPIIAMLFGGQQWDLLTGKDGVTTMIHFKGYKGYRYGLVPIYETLGLDDDTIVDADTFESWAATACADTTSEADKLKMYQKIVGALLDPIVALVGNVTENPLVWVCDYLPDIMYQLTSGAMSDYITNTLQGLFVILDTARPVFNFDLPALAELLESNADDNAILQGVCDWMSNTSITEALTAKGLFTGVKKITGIECASLIIEAVCGTLLMGGTKSVTSANGGPARTVALVDHTDGVDANKYQPWDVMTVILEVILEICQYEGNADAVELLIGGKFVDIDEDKGTTTPKGIIKAFIALLQSDIGVDDYATIDWLQNFKRPDGTEFTQWDWISGSYALEDLTTPDTLDRIDTYLSYNTNWTEELADYLDINLTNIINSVIAMIPSIEGDSIAEIINGLVDGILSTDGIIDILDSIFDALSGLDALLDTVDLFLDIDLTALMDDGNEDDGGMKYGLMPGVELSLEDAITIFEDKLGPVSALLDWLLLGDDYEIFTGSDYVKHYDENGKLVKEDGLAIIHLGGAEGYDLGLVPILEAICRPAGIEVKGADTVRAENAEKKANGEVEDATLRAIVDPLKELVAKLATDDCVDIVFDILNNFIYFLSVDGLSTCLLNILSGVLNMAASLDEQEVFQGLELEGFENGLIAYLNDLITIKSYETDEDGEYVIDEDTEEKVVKKSCSFNLKYEDGKVTVDLSLAKVLEAVCVLAGDLDLTTLADFFVDEYYLGYFDYYESANGNMAGMMRFTDYFDENGLPNLNLDDTFYKGTRSDFVTVLLCLALDVIEEPGNKNFFINLFKKSADGDTDEEKLKNAEVLYNEFIDLLGGDPGDVEYDDYDWDTFIDGVEQDDDITSADMCYLKYNTNWTRSAAAYVYNNDTEIINGVLALLAEDGEDAQTIEEIIDGILNGKLFTADLVSKAYTAVFGLIDTLKEADETGYITEVVRLALDVDISKYDDLKDNVTKVTTVDDETDEETVTYVYEFNDYEDAQEQFIDAMADLIAPVEPLLDWLFADKYISLFTDYGDDDQDKGEPQVVIKGAKGYEKGIYQLLTQLNIDAPTAEKYEKALAKHDGSGAKLLLTAIADWINDIAESPIHEVAELLPQLIYFLQTGNLKVAITNGLKAVFNLLDRIRPIYDIDLEGLVVDALGVELEEDETVYDLLAYDNLINLLEKWTGIKLADVVTEAINGTYFPDSDDESKCIINKETGKIQYIEGKFEPYDALTLLVSLVVDLVMVEWDEEVEGETVHKTNATQIETFINSFGDGEEVIKPGTIAAILGAFDTEITGLKSIDWFYFDEDFKVTEFADGQDITMPQQSIVYLENYTANNIWNKDTVDYLDDNLQDIIDAVIAIIYADKDEHYQNLSELLNALINGADIFNDDTINSIVSQIVPILEKIDLSLTDTVKMVLGIDLSYYKALTGNEVWGVTDLDSFVATLKQLLTPLCPLLNWLLLGEDYTFLNGSSYSVGDGEALITIKGADGYDLGLVPLFEAIVGPAGITMMSGDQVKAANAVKKATGKSENAILDAILDPILSLAHKLIDGDTVNVLGAVLNNLFYFLNTNGISVSINNMLIAALNITDSLDESGLVDLDVYELVNDLLNDSLGLEGDKAIDVENLGVKNICDIVENLTGINIYNYLGKFLENAEGKYFVGHLHMFKSANGQPALRLEFNDEGLGTSGDFYTCLISLVLDTIEDSENADAIVTLLAGVSDDDTPAEALEKKENAEKIYNAILNVLMDEPADYEPAETDFEGFINIINSSEFTSADMCYLKYSKNWTREGAKTLYENNEAIIDSVLALVAGEDEEAKTLDGILEELIYGNLYTEELVNSLYDALTGLYADLEEKAGVEAFDHIINVLNIALKVDLSVYGPEGDIGSTGGYSFDPRNDAKDEFVNALSDLLAPFEVVLEWLLTGKDLELFVDGDTTNSQICIKGSYGYRDGLIRLYKALEMNPVNAATFATDLAKHDGSGIKDLLVPITELLAKTGDDALITLCNLIPQLIFYIQSGDLKTTIVNLLGSALNLIDRIDGIYEIDLAELLASVLPEEIEVPEDDVFDILTWDNLIAILENLTGLTLDPIITEAIYGTYYPVSDGSDNTHTDLCTINSDYQIEFCDAFQPYDVLTLIISVALELVKYDGNTAVFEKMLGLNEGTINAVLDILDKQAITAGLMDIDWFCYDNTEFDADPFTEGQTVATTQSIVYLTYPNNWSKNLSDDLDLSLETIADMIINLIYSEKDEGYTCLNDLLIGMTADIFSDDMINSIIKLVVPYIEAVDENLLTVADVMFDTDLTYYKGLTGSETWGVVDFNTFCDALVDVLTPVAPILEWILLDHDYEFFSGSDNVDKDNGEPILVLAGRDGYDYGIVPLLEVLVKGAGINVKSGDQVKAELEAGDKSALVKAILDPINTLFTAITTGEYKQDGETIQVSSVDVVLDLLNNLLYFIEANGLSASLHNLLVLAFNVTDTIDAKLETDDLDLNKIVNDLVKDKLELEDFDITNVRIKTVCDIVESLTGLDIYTVCGEFLESYFCGEMVAYRSANGQPAIRLQFSDDYENEHTGTRSDFITILLSLVLQVIENADNKEAIIELLGDDEDAADTYQGIINLFKLGDYSIPYDTIDWKFVDKKTGEPDGEAHSPIENSTALIKYGKYWTRDKAEYVDEHLDACVDQLIHLIGIELSDDTGEIIKLNNLEDLLNGLISGSLYTQDIVNKLLNKLLEILETLDNIDRDGTIKLLVKDLLGVDLTAYDKYYTDYDWGFADGDRAGFTQALLDMLMPLAPVLEWTLLDGRWAFFVDDEGNDQIVLTGARGYNYGIIPILEALDCQGILTEAELAAAYAENPEAILTSILNPVLDKIDDIMTDPANKIMNLLPRVVYFIESDGLSACWRNLLLGAYKVTEAISPLYDVDLGQLVFKMDIHTVEQGGELDLFKILSDLLNDFEEKTGFTFTDIAVSLVNDLSTGVVYKFTSLNGETAYSMEYNEDAGLGDRADLITAVLCIAMEFIATDGNAEALKELVQEYLPDTSSEYVTALIDTLYSAVTTNPDEHVDLMLTTIWYIFYGADKAVEATDDWLNDYNADWQFIIDLMQHAETDAIADLGKKFADLLDTYLDGIYDSEGLASDGAVTFVQKLIAFFQKIIQFFKNLFS